MDNCEKVITIPQFNSTCWFNSILMITFYSKYCRLLLKNKVKFLENPTDIQKLFINIINTSYLEYGNNDPYELVTKLYTPDDILYILNKLDSTEFNFCPNINSPGYIPGFYIHRFLNIFIPYEKILYLDLLPNNTYIISSIFLNDYLYNNNITEFSINDIEKISELMNNIHFNYLLGYIDVIIINTLFNTGSISFLQSHDMYLPIELNKYNDSIFINNNEFILDSVILKNYNTDMFDNNAHAIAGITCHNKRYLYNGWVSTTNDPSIQSNLTYTLPCNLMKFDWKNSSSFYLSNDSCEFKQINYDMSKLFTNLCFDFNFNSNIHIYINKQSTNLTNIN